METDDPCTTPYDGDNPSILSNIIGVGPFSLLLGSEYMPGTPPPTYLSISYLNRERATDKNSQLAGYIVLPEGGLQCVDERILENQRGVIMDVIAQVTACLLKGKGLVGLSLPIRLFEPRSTLERMLDRWSFLEVFLRDVSSLNSLEKFKKVILMAVAGLYVYPSQEKPFNPLLGETLEAYWPNGTQIYCEHTCHHPPITNFSILANGFKIEGHLELVGKFKQNSLIGGFNGKVYVKFASGEVISYTNPQFRAGGMIFGSRTVNWEREMVFEDTRNKLQATISFGPKKKKSWFKKAVGKNDDFSGEIMYNGNKVSEITGSWLEGLSFDGVKEWDANVHTPIFHKFIKNPLPSDWRYREDLVWLAKGNSEIAQKWKYRIENKQRDDRKLRVHKN
jgi:oxysterol-binding protein-related protein 8